MSAASDLHDAEQFAGRVRLKRSAGRKPTLASVLDQISGRGDDAGQHEEQMRHFKGYPYAIIKTIAHRLAGQQLHLARKVRGRKVEPQRKPSFKSVPRTLFKDVNTATELEIINDHEFLTAIDRPNQIMVRWTLFYNTWVNLETTAKAFWWVKKSDDGSGKKEIWPVPPQWVTPIHTDTKIFVGWTISPNGAEKFDVPASEMGYFYYSDPSDPFAAYSPMQAAATSVYADEAIEESQRRSFVNGVNPGLALMVGKLPDMAGVGQDQRPILTLDQRQQIIGQIKRYYRGVANTDEPLILDGFITDAKRITTTPREMDYLTSGQETKTRLNTIWGVNRISMGETGTNRAESAVADQHLCDNALNPRISMFSQALTRFVLPMFGLGEEYVAYVDNATSMDPELALQVEIALMDRMSMTRNELRARHGLEPMEGGDTFFVPTSSAGPGGSVLTPYDADPMGGDMLSPIDLLDPEIVDPTADETSLPALVPVRGLDRKLAIRQQRWREMLAGKELVRAGLLKRNEWRVKNGLPAEPGGDHLEVDPSLLPLGWTEPDAPV
jgi:phage portal protein BeeE